MKREQSQKKQERGIAEGKTSQKKTLWNVCVLRKGEAEERHEPSSLPDGVVEVGVRKPPPDLLQEVPARGAVSNMVTGRAGFVFS